MNVPPPTLSPAVTLIFTVSLSSSNASELLMVIGRANSVEYGAIEKLPLPTASFIL